MRNRRAAMLSFVAAAVVAACATVADLDVEHDRGPVGDSDDSGVTEDTNGRVPQADGGGPIGDAKPDTPPDFAPCACPVTDGCCVPPTGNGTCLAPANPSTCTSANGIFLRCVASDVDNGRACCLAGDTRSSFFAGTCRDAGGQLCVKDDECDTARGEGCVKTTCRQVSVSVCVEEGGALPACPP